MCSIIIKLKKNNKTGMWYVEQNIIKQNVWNDMEKDVMKGKIKKDKEKGKNDGKWNGPKFSEFHNILTEGDRNV